MRAIFKFVLAWHMACNIREQAKNNLMEDSMTKQQFQNQFQTRLVYDDYLKNILQPDSIFQDTQIYRAMEKLVIVKDDGHYYMR